MYGIKKRLLTGERRTPFHMIVLQTHTYIGHEGQERWRVESLDDAGSRYITREE